MTAECPTERLIDLSISGEESYNKNSRASLENKLRESSNPALLLFESSNPAETSLEIVSSCASSLQLCPNDEPSSKISLIDNSENISADFSKVDGKTEEVHSENTADQQISSDLGNFANNLGLITNQDLDCFATPIDTKHVCKSICFEFDEDIFSRELTAAEFEEISTQAELVVKYLEEHYPEYSKKAMKKVPFLCDSLKNKLISLSDSSSNDFSFSLLNSANVTSVGKTEKKVEKMLYICDKSFDFDNKENYPDNSHAPLNSKNTEINADSVISIKHDYQVPEKKESSVPVMLAYRANFNNLDNILSNKCKIEGKEQTETKPDLEVASSEYKGGHNQDFEQTEENDFSGTKGTEYHPVTDPVKETESMGHGSCSQVNSCANAEMCEEGNCLTDGGEINKTFIFHESLADKGNSFFRLNMEDEENYYMDDIRDNQILNITTVISNADCQDKCSNSNVQGDVDESEYQRLQDKDKDDGVNDHSVLDAEPQTKNIMNSTIDLCHHNSLLEPKNENTEDKYFSNPADVSHESNNQLVVESNLLNDTFKIESESDCPNENRIDDAPANIVSNDATFVTDPLNATYHCNGMTFINQVQHHDGIYTNNDATFLNDSRDSEIHSRAETESLSPDPSQKVGEELENYKLQGAIPKRSLLRKNTFKCPKSQLQKTFQHEPSRKLELNQPTVSDCGSSGVSSITVPKAVGRNRFSLKKPENIPKIASTDEQNNLNQLGSKQKSNIKIPKAVSGVNTRNDRKSDNGVQVKSKVSQVLSRPKGTSLESPCTKPNLLKSKLPGSSVLPTGQLQTLKRPVLGNSAGTKTKLPETKWSPQHLSVTASSKNSQASNSIFQKPSIPSKIQTSRRFAAKVISGHSATAAKASKEMTELPSKQAPKGTGKIANQRLPQLKRTAITAAVTSIKQTIMSPLSSGLRASAESLLSLTPKCTSTPRRQSLNQSFNVLTPMKLSSKDSVNLKF